VRKRRLDRKPRQPVNEDQVQRDFMSDEPNRKWVTDMTEQPTGEGKIYCCAVKGVFSDRIVGYAIKSATS